MRSERGLLRFGPFALDPGTGELWRDGAPVDLPPQPTRLLVLLVRRAGRLVTREEIREELWGDAVVEFDQAINHAVRQVREALGDDAAAPTYVETVPRRGYRFAAVVEAASGTSSSPSTTSSPDRDRGRGSSRNGSLTRALVVGAAAIAVGWVGWMLSSSAGVEPVTVAVVPVRVATAEPGAEAFGLALTEALATTLGSLAPERLEVTEWNWDTVIDPVSGEVTRDGEAVDLDFVVESNVGSSEPRRVAAFVTGLPEGRQLWYRRFSVESGSEAEALRRIPEAVARAVRTNLLDHGGS